MASFKDRINNLWEDAKDDDYRTTQKQFADKFGATRSQLQGWLIGAGEPDSEMMKTIATRSGVSVDWLIGLTDLRKPYVLTPGSPEYQRALDKINKEEWHEFKESGIKVSAKDKDKFTEEEVKQIVEEVLEKIKERKED
jgi:transcriptional regulator with XRE-family HTH domain